MTELFNSSDPLGQLASNPHHTNAPDRPVRIHDNDKETFSFDTQTLESNGAHPQPLIRLTNIPKARK